MRFLCEDGLAPEGLQPVVVTSASASLVLEGRSFSDALLYRGRVTVGPEREGETVSVTLRFVGGS